MGYVTRAEYTLEIIRQPNAYDHITQQFLCTGFLLGSSFDESVLEAILAKWHEIDAVTSNRVRFLFFIDNECQIRWGNRFEDSKFKRHHVDFLRTARVNGFEISTQPGAQIAVGGRNQEPWYPYERVRHLAQQLGVSTLMPCLVWVRDDATTVLYVKRLATRKSDDIFSIIRSFCDRFYDRNSVALSNMDALERVLERQCGSLELTIKELDVLETLHHEYRRLMDCLKSIQEVGSLNQPVGEEIQKLSDQAVKILELHQLPVHPVFWKVLRKVKKWARQCEAVKGFLQGDKHIPVGYAASAFVNCFDLIGQLPQYAARLSPPKEKALPLFMKEFLGLTSRGLVESLVSSGNADLAARVQRYSDYLVVLKGSQPYSAIASNAPTFYATLVNMASVLRELATTPGADDAKVGELSREIDSRLLQLFDSETRATAISVHLWIYYQLVDARATLERKLRRIARNAEYTYDEWAARREELGYQLAKISEGTKDLDWSAALEDYETHQLPASALQAISTKVPRTKHSRSVFDEMDRRISRRLTPVALVMQQLAETAVVPFADYARQVQAKHSVQVMVSPGAQMGFANNIYNTWKDKSMNSVKVTLGDGTVFHGDFAVAEVIKNSFNRAESTESGETLKGLLKDLTGSVAKLTEAVSAELAKEAADDLEMFVKEAARATPRKKWYELSAAGLLDAAKGVGAAGSSVVELVNKIVGMLGA